VAIIIVYMMSNIAHIRYFWQLPKRGVLTHVLAPALGVVSLAYPLYSVTAPGQLFPYNWVPIVVGVWILAGVLLYLYYRARSPEKIAAIGTFVGGEDPEPVEAVAPVEPLGVVQPPVRHG
jgi:amino acid transporter